MHFSNATGKPYISTFDLSFKEVKKQVKKNFGVVALELRYGAEMKDKGLKWILKHEHCKGLYLLNVPGCCITDKGMKEFANGYPNLGGLNVSNCGKLSDKSLKYLSIGCSGLTHLNLTNCKKITDKGLEALRAGCPGLVEIHLTGCQKITQNELDEFQSQFGGRLTIHRP